MTLQLPETSTAAAAARIDPHHPYVRRRPATRSFQAA